MTFSFWKSASIVTGMWHRKTYPSLSLVIRHIVKRVVLNTFLHTLTVYECNRTMYSVICWSRCEAAALRWIRVTTFLVGWPFKSRLSWVQVPPENLQASPELSQGPGLLSELPTRGPQPSLGISSVRPTSSPNPPTAATAAYATNLNGANVWSVMRRSSDRWLIWVNLSLWLEERERERRDLHPACSHTPMN